MLKIAKDAGIYAVFCFVLIISYKLIFRFKDIADIFERGLEMGIAVFLGFLLLLYIIIFIILVMKKEIT
ncbi:hypothetical protein JFL43_20210 [Viridibacillus sp. YIM B01967]|uniref:ABC transporter permease n=1 Tax=Viridibacillus soli TaxID=2798301 RepID=A0ABS1HCX8_9BACL|nr:hypothetical protein [Viridibacillus soli]MBK3497114.1 hypothetical protein [Viridibacillus soli]